MDATYFELPDGDLAQAKDALSKAVTETLQTERHRLIVGLDRLPTLDVARIAGLISGLRRLREVGGSISLVASRPDVLRTLATTGLDHVFSVYPSLELAERQPARPPSGPGKRSPGLRVAAAVLGLAVFLLGPGAVRAQGDGQVDPLALIAKLVERNPNLDSFEAKVHVNIHMTSFPFLAPQLDGDTYFKRPNNYEVVFQHVPSYAKGFDKIYADIGDPASWNKRFTIAYDGTRPFGNHEDVDLRMVQRVRGMIDHEDVLVDPVNDAIDAMVYHYYNGGVIELHQKYSNIDGFAVVVQQSVTIAIPFIKAKAEAVYSDYHTNVALDDSVFTKKRPDAEVK